MTWSSPHPHPHSSSLLPPLLTWSKAWSGSNRALHFSKNLQTCHLSERERRLGGHKHPHPALVTWSTSKQLTSRKTKTPKQDAEGRVTNLSVRDKECSNLCRETCAVYLVHFDRGYEANWNTATLPTRRVFIFIHINDKQMIYVF